MAFPQDPLPIRAEMQIDGEWTEVTSDVRLADDIRITGGFAPEQTAIAPSTIAFTLGNPDGLYSDDNPLSAYYGLLPTGTPFRVAIEESAPFLRLPNGVMQDPLTATAATTLTSYVETADKAVLDITGDLDIRIELEPDTWQLGSVGHHLAGKYTISTSNRSWGWVVQPSGLMRLYWSADGLSPTTPGTIADSTEEIPAAGRVALRVTIDVNNGAAGRTITFYTSDSITGTWTQLGDAVVQAGTTSIFSSTSKLTVGAVIDSANGQMAFVTDGDAGHTMPMVGRVHRFQLRSGIAGTLVADMNAAVQSEGATTWSDGLGTPNTWTLVGSAEITAADYRGYGEIAEMPQEWDPTGTDVFTRTVASGIVRRLTQGAQSLNSSIFRNLRQYIGAGAVSYLPLEGGSQSTAAGNAVPGQPAGRVTNVLFSADSEFPASAGVMSLVDSDSRILCTVTGAASSDQATLIFYHMIDSAPASDTPFVSFFTSGTVKQLAFSIDSTSYRATAYDATGASLGSTAAAFGTGAGPGQWIAVQMRLNKNGTGVDINLAWYPLGSAVFFGTAATTLASSTVGSIIGISTSTGISSLPINPKIAHIMALNLVDFEFANLPFARMSVAFIGEYAAERWLRLLREEGIEGRCVGWPADTTTMGPQLIDTLMANLTDCAVTSGSLQFEARDLAALLFRTYRSLLAQQAVELAYPRPDSHLSGSFRPTIDDQGLRNDVTANSPGGAFARATRDSGPRSTALPPEGSGRYDSTIFVNPETDDGLLGQAQWAVFLGTWPDRRVPNLEVWLERSIFTADATLTRQVRSTDPGDRVLVADVPVWVGGGDQDTLVRGYVETLMNRGHRIAWSTLPYGPYREVSELSTTVVRRASTAYGNARIALAATSGAGSLVVQTTEGKTWGTTAGKPGNFPLDIIAAGEQVTVSAIAAWVADNFNRVGASTWGSTSTGSFAWTNTGGSASDYSTSGTVGTHNLATTATDRTSTITLAARVPEVLITHLRMPTALTGVGGTCSMSCRIGNTSTDFVELSVQMTTAGGMVHWVRQIVGGVETVFDSAFPSTGLTSTTAFSVRIHVDGTTVRARLWAESVTEPDGTWTTSATLTQANASGNVQLRSTRNASSTNAAPFNVEFDGLSLPRNQLFTASARAVNGATKAQTVDGVVTLIDKFYVARS